MNKYSIAFLMTLAPLSAKAADIKGTWLTEEGKAHVVMAPCGSSVCGKIVWLKEPNDKVGKPHVDELNTDQHLRMRPIIGLQLTEVAASDDGSWKGQIYNPEEGKSYAASMAVQSDGTLLIRGCILGGMLCDTNTWTRIK